MSVSAKEALEIWKWMNMTRRNKHLYQLRGVGARTARIYSFYSTISANVCFVSEEPWSLVHVESVSLVLMLCTECDINFQRHDSYRRWCEIIKGLLCLTDDDYSMKEAALSNGFICTQLYTGSVRGGVWLMPLTLKDLKKVFCARGHKVKSWSFQLYSTVWEKYCLIGQRNSICSLKEQANNIKWSLIPWNVI